jgi:hypothetical protein
VSTFKDFAETLTHEQRTLLAEVHELVGWGCVAHDEGQTCCVDFILEDEHETS